MRKMLLASCFGAVAMLSAGYASANEELIKLSGDAKQWVMPRGNFNATGYSELNWIFFLIPKAVIFPILIFVGLEITAKSFHATPVRHYPAVAFACVPALAYLALLTLKQIMPELGKSFAELAPPTQHWVQTVTVLAGGAASSSPACCGGPLAHMIDGRVRPLVLTLLLAAVFSWFGVIHSPLPSSPIMAPGASFVSWKQKDGPGFDLPDPVSLGSGLCSDVARARGAAPVWVAARPQRTGILAGIVGLSRSPASERFGATHSARQPSARYRRELAGAIR